MSHVCEAVAQKKHEEGGPQLDLQKDGIDAIDGELLENVRHHHTADHTSESTDHEA